MTDWNKLKVLDLKAELKKRGLVQSGAKAALVARLTDAENEGFESEATLQDDAVKPDNASATSPESFTNQQTSDHSADNLPDTPPASTAVMKAQSPQAFGEEAVEDQVTQESATASAPSPIAYLPEKTPNSESQSHLLPSQTALTVESTQPPTQDSHKSALPSAEPQEIIEDKQKRKRRSQSPIPSTADSARKRARQDDLAKVNPKIATSTEDAAWVETHNAVDTADINAEAMEVDPVGNGGEVQPVIIDVAKEAVTIQDVSSTNPAVRDPLPDDSGEMEDNSESKSKYGENLDLNEDSPKVRDSRFKDLFPTNQPSRHEQSTSNDPAVVDAMDIEPERSISPAIHPATSALYIRDFMRPLNPSQLQNYLATLAAPPGQEPDQDVIINFFLDPIRTHAFISFKTISAASRVRSAIHDRIWPEERTRKPLWADFVPSEKVDMWIAEEQVSSSSARSGKKWEVYYDVDEDRNVSATLQEATGVSGPQVSRKPSGPISAPHIPAGPRGVEGAPTGPRAKQHLHMPPTNLSTLNQMFKRTTAKPPIYWKPVTKQLADKRLDRIEDATSDRYISRQTGGDVNRYSFEGADVLIDRGREVFPGLRPPVGFRAPFPGGHSRGGGPHRGRGGYDSYGRAPDRRYDSYRGGDRRDDRRY